MAEDAPPQGLCAPAALRDWCKAQLLARRSAARARAAFEASLARKAEEKLADARRCLALSTGAGAGAAVGAGAGASAESAAAVANPFAPASCNSNSEGGRLMQFGLARGLMRFKLLLTDARDVQPPFVGMWSRAEATAALARLRNQQREARLTGAAGNGSGAAGAECPEGLPFICAEGRPRLSARRPTGVDTSLFAYEIDSEAAWKGATMRGPQAARAAPTRGDSVALSAAAEQVLAANFLFGDAHQSAGHQLQLAQVLVASAAAGVAHGDALRGEGAGGAGDAGTGADKRFDKSPVVHAASQPRQSLLRPAPIDTVLYGRGGQRYLGGGVSIRPAMVNSDELLCRARLAAERKDLSQGALPVGFSARPAKAADGSVDLRRWRLGIRPAATSAYKLPTAGATYNVELDFPASYPEAPPIARFAPPIFHTNVFPNDGAVCLSLLLADHGGRVSQHWSPTVTMREILLGLQTFFDEPNATSVANAEASELLSAKGRERYDERVKADARTYEARLAAHQAGQPFNDGGSGGSSTAPPPPGGWQATPTAPAVCGGAALSAAAEQVLAANFFFGDVHQRASEPRN